MECCPSQREDRQQFWRTPSDLLIAEQGEFDAGMPIEKGSWKHDWDEFGWIEPEEDEEGLGDVWTHKKLVMKQLKKTSSTFRPWLIMKGIPGEPRG